MDEGFKAMMVELLKQMHLQKDVAVERAERTVVVRVKVARSRVRSGSRMVQKEDQ